MVEKESQRGKFDLEVLDPEEYRGKPRGIGFSVASREDIYFGNPREGQYLKVGLISYGAEDARIVAFEKVGAKENYIKTLNIRLGTNYRLRGTSVVLRLEHNTYTEAMNLRFEFSGPGNVDVLRGRIFERYYKESRGKHDHRG